MRIATSRAGIGLLALLLPVLVAGPAAAQRDPGEKTVDERIVNLSIRELPLKSAIELLFQGTELTFAVNRDVPNVPISVNIRDQAFPMALKTLVRVASAQVPNLTYSFVDGVYSFKLRTPPPPEIVPQVPDEPAGAQAEVFRWEKLQLQQIDVRTAALIFGGALLPTEADLYGGLFGGGGFGSGLGGGGFGNGFGGGGFGSGLGGGGFGNGGFGNGGFGNGGFGNGGFGNGGFGNGGFGNGGFGNGNFGGGRRGGPPGFGNGGPGRF